MKRLLENDNEMFFQSGRNSFVYTDRTFEIKIHYKPDYKPVKSRFQSDPNRQKQIYYRYIEM